MNSPFQSLASVAVLCFAFASVAAGQPNDPADDSGRIDDYNQWKQALGNDGATGAAQVWAVPGFEVDLVRAAGPRDGSWISLAFDPLGRILLGREDRGILRLTLAQGPENQQRLETINDTLLECRGLLMVGDDLFANANNNKGLYRLRDTQGDDQYDEVRLLRAMPGNVGHGRNDLVLGPDGLIYLICGNDVELPEDFAAGASPYRHYAIDRLLPCPWNDSLFNFGALPPAGHVVRTDTEGKRWEIVAGGFRNAYGIDFNTDGEMFTFDADMEWDAGLPWYRPCRVNHIVSGADYGWRQGIGKWPFWYPDSLPATLDIGLASPTAVMFGTRSNFPTRYREALFILDWAYGRILSIHMQPAGTSYTARAETFLKGRPLNVTDLAFGPDGAMYFTTGGRKTQSGLYRVRYVDGPPGEGEFSMLRDLPGATLAAGMRQLRRDIESFHGRVDSKAVPSVWEYLESSDQWLLHAARIAIEAQPPETWAERALSEEKHQTGLTSLMALARTGTPAMQAPILARLKHFSSQDLNPFQRASLLRAYALVFLRLGESTIEQRAEAAAVAAKMIPSEIAPVNQLAAELLAYLADPTAPKRILGLLAQAKTQEEKIHYLYVLSQTKTGWTPPLRRELLVYLRDANRFHGARYVPQAISHIRADVIAQLSDEQRNQFATLLKPIAVAAEISLPAAPLRPFVRHWEMDDLVGSLGEADRTSDLENGRRMFVAAQCAACHKVGTEGGLVGPDLSAVARRFGRRDLLESIISPSRVVDDKYRNVAVVTVSGSVHTGMLLGSDEQSIRIAANPLLPAETIQIARNDIESQQFSLVSPMPQGTLDRLTKAEILDLLDFLEAAAQAAPQALP